MVPRLSLCIPTFNRAAFIGETLESIIAQATDDVEIVVVDGASTDGTEEVIRIFQKRFPRLRYHRGDRNMGVERDTQKAVELAEGNYCWLMCSDDVLKPGAIKPPSEVFSPMEAAKYTTVYEIDQIWRQRFDLVETMQFNAFAGEPVMTLSGPDQFRYTTARALVLLDRLLCGMGISKGFVRIMIARKK